MKYSTVFFESIRENGLFLSFFLKTFILSIDIFFFILYNQCIMGRNGALYDRTPFYHPWTEVTGVGNRRTEQIIYVVGNGENCYGYSQQEFSFAA